MNLIVAVDQNWAIGKDGDQLIYIPEDLRRFQKLTQGHPVIFGRKTMNTFPGKRPLGGRRRNLVISKTLSPQPGLEVFHSIEDLLAVAPDDSFVMGGASVYRALLNRCDRAYVTWIEKSFLADCWFPNLDLSPQWVLLGESPKKVYEGVKFHFRIYSRVCPIYNPVNP